MHVSSWLCRRPQFLHSPFHLRVGPCSRLSFHSQFFLLLPVGACWLVAATYSDCSFSIFNCFCCSFTLSDCLTISMVVFRVSPGMSCNFCDSFLSRMPTTMRSRISWSFISPYSNVSAIVCKSVMKSSAFSVNVWYLSLNTVRSIITFLDIMK